MATSLTFGTRVRWLDGAHDQDMVLYNGQHRLEANGQLIRDAIQVLANSNFSGSPRESLETSVHESRFWGVKFYDLGM